MRRGTWMRLAPAVLVAIVGTTPAFAQQPAQPATQGQTASGKMTMDCHAMMASRQKMMEDMKAMDAQLDTLVQKMNGATGQAKVDATAAVVAELVSQRKTMHERMASMQSGTMQHMMEHMQAGGGKGMMDCPMMKKMGGGAK